MADPASLARYRLFGWTLDFDRPVEALREVRCEASTDRSAPVDITVGLSGFSDLEAGERGELLLRNAELAIHRSGDRVHLAYADGTELLIELPDRIRVRSPPSNTEADTLTYLLGPALGYLLRLRGVLALHASIVMIDGRAVLLAGPSGSGKSTTAAAFAELGFDVLADDVATIREEGGQLITHPDWRFLKLWPSSLRWLRAGTGVEPLSPTWTKLRLPLSGPDSSVDGPFPLGAVYLLAPIGEGAESFESCGEQQAFEMALANSFAAQALSATEKAIELDQIARLVRTVPFRSRRRHTLGWEPATVASRIVDDHRNLVSIA